jgi:hypothetical protein
VHSPEFNPQYHEKNKKKMMVKIELAYDYAMLLLYIYPKECKSAHNSDTYTLKFIAALVTTAKLWNQPRCPSAEE